MKLTKTLMWHTFLTLLISISLPLGAHAAGKTNDVLEGVQQLTLPVFPNASDSPEFQLCYLVKNQDKAEQGTIFYLDGGPGGHSVENLAQGKSLLPDGYQLVVMNLRGFGCSGFEGQTGLPSAFNTELATHDAVELIKHLQLSNYIIYAVSYGTWHATQVAAQLSQEDVEQPKAVLLEGVIARSFRTEDVEIFTTFAELWQDVFSSLSQTAQEVFSGSELPLGYTSTEWGKIIMSVLPQGTAVFNSGTDWVKFNNMKNIFELSAQSNLPEEAKNSLLAQLNPYLATHERKAEELFAYQQIVCAEISSANNEDARLEGGELILENNFREFCKDAPRLKSAHTRNWQIRAPIVYIQGQKDPNTPHYMALEHFRGQQSAERRFFSVAEAGHNPIAASLADCSSVVWASIFNQSLTEQTFDLCLFEVEQITE